MKARDAAPAILRPLFVHVSLHGVLQVMGIVRMALWAFLFPPARLGHVFTALLVLDLLSQRRVHAFHKALVQADEEVAREDFGAALTLCLVLDTLVVLAICLVAEPLAGTFGSPSLAGLLYLVAPLAFGHSLTLPEVWWYRRMRFSRDKAAQAAGVAVEFAVLAATFQALGLRSLPVSLLAGLGARVFSLWWGSPVGFRPALGSAGAFRRLIAYAWPLIVSGLTFRLQFSSIEWLVRLLRSPADLACYRLALRVLAPFRDLLVQAGLPLFSAWSRQKSEPDGLREAHREAWSRYQAVALPAVVLVGLAAPGVIPAVLGPAWAAAVPLVRILALTHVLWGLIGAIFWWETVRASGKTWVCLVTDAAMGVAAVAGGLLILGEGGLERAAWLRLLQVAVVGGACGHLAVRLATGGWTTWLALSVPSAVATVVAALPFLFLPQTLVAAVGGSVAFCVLYLGVMAAYRWMGRSTWVGSLIDSF